MAKIGEKVVGFIACRIEHDESITTTDESNTFGYISDAWTDQQYRKRGVFKKLNAAAEDYFRGFPHISIVKLNVVAGNKPAIAAYENTDYRTQEFTLWKRIK